MSSYYRPDGISAWKTGLARVATLAGILMGAANVAFTLSNPATAALGLGELLLTTGAGSGLVLGAVSAAGFISAGKALDVKREAKIRLAEFKKADAEGRPPNLPPSKAFDERNQATGLTTGLAKFGGLAFAVMGAAMLFGALMSGGIGGIALGPHLFAGMATTVIGYSAWAGADVADQARTYVGMVKQEEAELRAAWAASGEEMDAAPDKRRTNHAARLLASREFSATERGV